jgi:Protein of unknown function (DUF3108)
VLAVALLHGLLLQGLAEGIGGPATMPVPASAGPVQVRAVSALPHAASPTAAAPAPVVVARPPPPRAEATLPTRPVVPRAAAGDSPEAAPSPRTAALAMPAAAPTSAPTTAPTTAPTSITPTPAPAAAPTPAPPRHPAALPPPFEAEFRLRRGGLAGRAQWRFEPRDGRYTLELQSRVLGREVGHLRSEGLLAADGLQPLRFVEGRRGRDQRAVNFQRDDAGGGRITFSGPGTELPLPPGVQDRLGWLLQLAALADASPALREPGARLSMWVVGVRGDLDLWTFEVAGTEPVAAADGTARPALALRRGPRRAWDTEVRVWLDPDARHLPVRATWRSDDGGSAVELERESLAWR